jgi:hypothetical protein
VVGELCGEHANQCGSHQQQHRQELQAGRQTDMLAGAAVPYWSLQPCQVQHVDTQVSNTTPLTSVQTSCFTALHQSGPCSTGGCV